MKISNLILKTDLTPAIATIAPIEESSMLLRKDSSLEDKGMLYKTVMEGDGGIINLTPQAYGEYLMKKSEKEVEERHEFFLNNVGENLASRFINNNLYRNILNNKDSLNKFELITKYIYGFISGIETNDTDKKVIIQKFYENLSNHMTKEKFNLKEYSFDNNFIEIDLKNKRKYFLEKNMLNENEKINFENEFNNNLKGILKGEIKISDITSKIKLSNLTNELEIKDVIKNFKFDYSQYKWGPFKLKEKKNNDLTEKTFINNENIEEKDTQINQDKKIIENDNFVLSDDEINKTINFLEEAENDINKVVDFIKKLENKNKSFKNYLKNIKIFNGLSIVLTAAAWAIAATYTTASFFNFGITIAHSVAAGIQAGIMTYFSVEGKKTENEIENNINEIENFLNSEKIQEIKKNFKNKIETKKIISELKQKLQKTNIQLSLKDIYKFFSITEKAKEFHKFIFESTGKSVEWVLKKFASFFSKKNLFKINNGFLSAMLTKNNIITKKIVQAISKMTTKISLKKTLLISTTWASPISSFISFLDDILTIGSAINDIEYLNE
ncbi:hypothetical protein [Mesomycoplasma neurolyticum]|uniref:Uncharacterized protein n=1 Tax=Mesomycoplasma neurolyticum TaxID=2120 RepID=A0A449A6H9_9BACT|nr:hypothetical protein [Mesomycoplasma neurolyticum]VEU59829.1 Uncharacterised protein [Mesomycoplasma neurolyticum]